MSPIELLVCIVLVLISAFLASSEISLFSLSRFQLRFLKDHIQPSTHRNIKRLIQDPAGLLITTLVLNEVVNIALSSLITKSVVLQGGGVDLMQRIRNLIVGSSVTTLI